MWWVANASTISSENINASKRRSESRDFPPITSPLDTSVQIVTEVNSNVANVLNTQSMIGNVLFSLSAWNKEILEYLHFYYNQLNSKYNNNVVYINDDLENTDLCSSLNEEWNEWILKLFEEKYIKIEGNQIIPNKTLLKLKLSYVRATQEFLAINDIKKGIRKLWIIDKDGIDDFIKDYRFYLSLPNDRRDKYILLSPDNSYTTTESLVNDKDLSFNSEEKRKSFILAYDVFLWELKKKAQGNRERKNILDKNISKDIEKLWITGQKNIDKLWITGQKNIDKFISDYEKAKTWNISIYLLDVNISVAKSEMAKCGILIEDEKERNAFVLAFWLYLKSTSKEILNHGKQRKLFPKREIKSENTEKKESEKKEKKEKKWWIKSRIINGLAKMGWIIKNLNPWGNK